LPVLLPIPAAIAPAIAATLLAPSVAMPDIGLSVIDGIGIAIAFARPVALDPATMLLGPAYVAVRSTIIVASVVMAPTPIMSVTPTMVFAIPFVALATPIAAMMIVHLVAPPTPVKDVEAIAGIPVVLIPAAAITDIVEAAAIVAVIIAVEGAVGIAAIAVVIIAVAIVIIAKAYSAVIITGRKPHRGRTQCCYPNGQFCTHSRHKTYPNMYLSALFPSWPIRRRGPS
jgi:hypothetical protein